MPDLSLTTGSSIVILGPSTVAPGWYSHYLMAYFYAYHPEKNLKVRQFGRGGAAILSFVTDPLAPNLSYEHYDQNAYCHFPDYVICSFGRNGGYTPEQYEDAYELLITNHIERDGAIPILVASEPDASLDGGAALLDPYEDTLPTLSAAHDDFPVALLYSDLFPVWTDPDKWVYIGREPDENHPGLGGHAAMAYRIIELLGWSTTISSATINASTATASVQTDCAVSSITRNRFGGIDFDRLDDRVPFQMDPAGYDDSLQLYPEIATFQDYIFTVSNLPAGTYGIYCDSTLLGTATHAELAVGLNVAKFHQGPIYDQGIAILNAVRDLQSEGLDSYDSAIKATAQYDTYNSHVTTNPSYPNPPLYALEGLPFTARAAIELANILVWEAAVHDAATPVTHTWSIRLTDWTPPIGIPDCAWGALHPITEPRPAQPAAWPSAEAAGYYYIDNTDTANATDTVNPYGYPNRPRLTIPETTYSAGSYVEIHGGPYVRRSADEEQDFVFSGTEANPCWIVAHDLTNKPELQGGFEVSGTYAIFDGILFKHDADAGVAKGPGIHVGGDLEAGTSYICFRNCEADGDAIELSGSASSCFNITGSAGDETHHIVFYNCSVHDYGDMIEIRPAGLCQVVFITWGY